MRRFRSALAAAAALAAFAGVGVAAAPAQAASYCTTKGQEYFCDYGITTTKFPDGTKEVFVVGTDHAVWTNWTRTDGSWHGWISMDGWVQSNVRLSVLNDDPYYFALFATGGDGNTWTRVHYHDGSWSSWSPKCILFPNGSGCA